MTEDMSLSQQYNKPRKRKAACIECDGSGIVAAYNGQEFATDECRTCWKRKNTVQEEKPVAVSAARLKSFKQFTCFNCRVNYAACAQSNPKYASSMVHLLFCDNCCAHNGQCTLIDQEQDKVTAEREAIKLQNEVKAQGLPDALTALQWAKEAEPVTPWALLAKQKECEEAAALEKQIAVAMMVVIINSDTGYEDRELAQRYRQLLHRYSYSPEHVGRYNKQFKSFLKRRRKHPNED